MLGFRGISKRLQTSCALASLLLASPGFGQNITIETVAVGDLGNSSDVAWSEFSWGPFGAVNYQYSIGRYEVTNAQYTAFLNAKAATDSHDLYSAGMAGEFGGIVRSGSAGSYAYSTVSGRENWAVNHVSFWDAARFTNWLENGQGNGDTETGTYTLGGVTNPTNASVTRSPGATWAITSENEWYKAAYYKGGGPNAGYWLYPTQSNAVSMAMANYGQWSPEALKRPTVVGSYPYSSGYGTFDMGGNVWEWNESILDRDPPSMLDRRDHRGLRGGSFFDFENSLQPGYRGNYDPALTNYTIGFRVSQIPGPGPLAALALGSLLTRGRRRQSRCAET